ncbi:polysaccharide lyase family protein [Marinicrinis lubricantis]|uniref:rhamnogalacturonan endolyase n=1 Tax=Marinicrinis lubricantis TaxID=2086470 RepID=A0ABW1IP71_9BACL
MKNAWKKTFIAVLLSFLGMFGFTVWTNASVHAATAESYRFDFGSGPAADGFIQVSCEDTYDSETGYGFKDGSIMNGRDRSQSSDPLERDFCFASAYSFLVDLPDGQYTVSLISGDQIATQAAMTVAAEGEVKLDGVGSPAGSFIYESLTVNVRDGQLTLEVEGNTARLNALQISPFYAFDFGPGDVSSDYTAVRCNTSYSEETGYGWSQLAGIDGTIQSQGDALHNDFCFGPELSFEVDLDNGTYKVTAISGDAEQNHSLTIFAEGKKVLDNVTAEAGQYTVGTFEANVVDGQLNLDFSGSPARINALTIAQILKEQAVPWPVDEGILLEDQGSSVTLTNSEISFTVNKSSPTISVLRKKGKYEEVNLLNVGRGYYNLNYFFESNREYGGTNMNYQIVSQTDDRVEISLSTDNPEVLPFRLDYRFVLEADSPGIYIYSIFDYHEGMPDGVEIEQSRYSFRGNPEIFTKYGIEDHSKGDRMGTFPTPQDIRNGESLMDATYRLPNGEIYTKYQHAVHMGDNNINGIFGEDIGLSIIRPSQEYLVGGPAKQEYFVEMTNTTPMVHWYEQVRHYGVPNIVPEKGWQKIYGPFFVYVNEAETTEALWADVKQQAVEEKAKWPYTWLEDSIYNTDQRSTVTGQLTVSDGSSAANAWVILGQPGMNVYEQNLDYLYYVRADEQGRFTIEDVRPGTYTLYAYTDHLFGEFHFDDIAVGANGTHDVGVLEWTPETHGDLIWQIGTPDRTPREFKFGDQLRQWGLWLQYPLDFPNDVDFVIGESIESEDWNYMHPATRTPGNVDHLLVPQDPTLAEWKIRFQSEETQGTGTLTIAIAGSSRGSLAVTLNGTTIAEYDQVIPIGNDASVYRAGETGYYHELTIPFDASLLTDGENIITLKHLGSNGSTDSIMYDALRLEIEPATIGSLQDQVTAYEQTGDLTAPLVIQLHNQLKQAEHHFQKEDMKQTVHFLQNFLKHLTQQEMQRYVSEEAQADLEARANALIDYLN